MSWKLVRWIRHYGLAAVSAGLLAPVAAAQPAPPEQNAARVAAERPTEDKTVLAVSAGGTLNTGNTRSYAGNLGARFNLLRGRHMLTVEANGTLARASVRDDTTGQFTAWTTNARNLIGKLRYDVFFTRDDAAFASMIGRHDTFAGLDLRLQNQVGYARTIFRREDKHRLWAELGYDLTYDNFHPDPLLDAMGMVLDGSEVVHSVRGFVGYDNHLNEAVTFLTGVEVLFDVQEPKNLRLTSTSELNSKIAGDFQLGLKFNLLFDNLPVAGKDKLDTITTLNLIYTLDASKRDAAE